MFPQRLILSSHNSHIVPTPWELRRNFVRVTFSRSSTAKGRCLQQLLAVHFDSRHRNRPMSSRLLFAMSGTMCVPVAVVGMGGCLAPYLVEIGHGVIIKLGSLDRCRRGGPAVTRRASPVFVRADSISTIAITLPSPNRPGCLSAIVRARVISKRGLDLLRLRPSLPLPALGAM